MTFIAMIVVVRVVGMVEVVAMLNCSLVMYLWRKFGQSMRKQHQKKENIHETRMKIE